MNNTFSVISPADNAPYVERVYAGRDDIEKRVNRAKTAQQAWKNVSLSRRKTLCAKAIDIFAAKSESMAEEICRQMGRPTRHAPMEIDETVKRAGTMIDLADQGLIPVNLPEKTGYKRWIEREPVGLVFVIAPWNYPYLTAINTVLPAILAGNSVILKHSIQTPLCAERLYETFKAGGLPEGVFQYLHLTHNDTEALIKDKRINHVSFTGSVTGGRMVERAVSGTFIGVGLELGGKDPAYIRSDTNLPQAVEATVEGAFFNSGQSCCAIERIYVHSKIYTEFVQQAVQLVKGYKLGRPDDPETTLGPVVRSSAADFVRDQIREAISQGAVPHIPPEMFPLDKTGTPYLAPQVLTEVNHTMRIMTEESFGPVVGIQKVDSDKEAIKLMNDSDYGLTAAIFTEDIKRGIELGRQLETGTFFINRCDYLDPELAWTGIKDSGHGCTLSALGYESLTRPKSFHIKTRITHSLHVG